MYSKCDAFGPHKNTIKVFNSNRDHLGHGECKIREILEPMMARQTCLMQLKVEFDHIYIDTRHFAKVQILL